MTKNEADFDAFASWRSVQPEAVQSDNLTAQVLRFICFQKDDDYEELVSIQKHQNECDARRAKELIGEMKDRDIPVISEDSSREELMQYIRILEERLQISHVYEMVPEAERGEEVAGDPRDRFSRMLKRVELSQERRVDSLRRGSDAIGVIMIKKLHELGEFDES